MKRKILVIEANDSKYSLLNTHLEDTNFPNDIVSRCTSIDEALSIGNKNIDIILASAAHGDTDSLTRLRTLQRHFINIPVVVLMDDETHAMQETEHGFLVYSNYKNIAARINLAIDVNDKLVNYTQNTALAAMIRAQKEQLDDILFSLNDAIWSRRADTMELVYANNAYYKLYDFTGGEKDPDRGQIFDSIHPDDRERFHATVKEIQTEVPTEIVFRYLHRDGSVKVLKATSRLKKGSGGFPDMINGITVDITKETELYNALRNSEQTMLATINNTKDMIWSVNRNLEIILCNMPYQDFIHSLVGRVPQPGNYVLGDWGSESFVLARTKDYERALNGESVTTVVEELYKGEVMYNEISSTPILDDNGEIIGVNCIARDITHQKKQFRKIREQNEKLREIAWIQSHKVRGPVASILGLSSLFDHRDASTEHNQDILEQMTRVTHELDKIIKEVVDTTFDSEYHLFGEPEVINSRQ